MQPTAGGEMMPPPPLSDGKSVSRRGLGGSPGHTEDTENPAVGAG